MPAPERVSSSDSQLVLGVGFRTMIRQKTKAAAVEIVIMKESRSISLTELLTVR